MWTLEFTKQSFKDGRRLRESNLWKRTETLIDILRRNPFQNPPPFEKLTKDLRGKYSRRINSQHRLVYEVFKDENIVRVLRMWSHYE